MLCKQKVFEEATLMCTFVYEQSGYSATIGLDVRFG